DVKLCGLHSCYRVQISSDVQANRTHRRRVPQSNAHGVCVIANKVAKPDGAVYVAAVVENSCAEPLFDSQRKAQFRIENEQLIASNGDLQVYASCGITGIAARRNGALRTRSVDRKSTKSGLTAREESFTGRNVTAAKRLGQSQSDPICPHRFAERLVVGSLSQKACKISVRSQKFWGDSQVQGLVKAAARIQRFVARVANPRRRQRRKP